jgi:hypothetical protein
MQQQSMPWPQKEQQQKWLGNEHRWNDSVEKAAAATEHQEQTSPASNLKRRPQPSTSQRKG